MHALLDADVLVYEIASMTDDEGSPLPWPIIEKLLNDHIYQILEVAGAETWQGYLTGKDNFRDEIATIKPYKGNRTRGTRPFWYSSVYNYLRDNRGCMVVNDYEADDAMAIYHSCSGGNTILCSRDKDLKQVAGWHYSWPSRLQKEQHPYYISELDGSRSFYSQLLTGDGTDNILGLYNVGDRAACVLRVKKAEDELSMFKEVKLQYELRFGSYWDMFMCENGRLLWMLRTEDDDWYRRQKELTQRL